MVKLRRNHSRTRSFGGRLLLLVIGASIALTWFLTNLEDNLQSSQGNAGLTELIISEDPRWYLPSSTTDEVLFKDHYSLSYSESHEQPEWVAYRLTKNSLEQPNVERTDWFVSDPDILLESAHYKDYSGSGMTRGHLVPAADMAFEEKAMEETFFMSNIAPQKKGFNGGIWRELEEQIRIWAWDRGELIVIAGPILTGDLEEWIGQNRVTVPEYFYKIVYDESENELIAFLLRNETSERHLKEYLVTVDTLEDLTGIDFFEKSLVGEKEQLESIIDPGSWKFNKNKFRLRIEKWNHQ